MKYSSNRGFTLIELLVVIAIIGILSSVVLASLNTARNKGNDAAVKSNLNGIRSQAELWYDSNGLVYSTGGATNVIACGNTAGSIFADPNINQAITAAQSASGQALKCVASSSVWAVEAVLRDGTRFCIDSAGNATTTTMGTRITAANPGEAKCD
ncbi:MAG: type II secretion system protein [Patescibacteria group bacterium]